MHMIDVMAIVMDLCYRIDSVMHVIDVMVMDVNIGLRL